MTTITCTKCGRKKYLDFILGSRFCIFCMKKTPNDIHIMVSDTVRVRDSFQIKKKSVGFRKFASKTIGGWFPSFKYENGVELSRTLDKEKDEYHEIVKDCATKVIIHEQHEKLSEHVGHGADKNNTMLR